MDTSLHEMLGVFLDVPKAIVRKKVLKSFDQRAHGHAHLIGSEDELVNLQVKIDLDKVMKWK